MCSYYIKPAILKIAKVGNIYKIVPKISAGCRLPADQMYYPNPKTKTKKTNTKTKTKQTKKRKWKTKTICLKWHRMDN